MSKFCLTGKKFFIKMRKAMNGREKFNQRKEYVWVQGGYQSLIKFSLFLVNQTT